VLDQRSPEGLEEKFAGVLRRRFPEGTRGRTALRSARRIWRRSGAVARGAIAVLGRPYLGPPAPEPLGPVLDVFGKSYPRAFFIQVGSNDADMLDPLRRQILGRQWSGIMIEPVPDIFERLQRKYSGKPGLVFENVAIADRDGTTELYYLPHSADAELPPWYDALASLRKDVILKHEKFIHDIEQRVATMQVPCLTFNSLCVKHGVSSADLIQIDTEGYDYEIIKQIDLSRLRPKLLMFEHLHMDTATRQACVSYLHAQGYEFLSNGMDTLCLLTNGLTDRDRALRRRWRQMRARKWPKDW